MQFIMLISRTISIVACVCLVLRWIHMLFDTASNRAVDDLNGGRTTSIEQQTRECLATFVLWLVDPYTRQSEVSTLQNSTKT